MPYYNLFFEEHLISNLPFNEENDTINRNPNRVLIQTKGRGCCDRCDSIPASPFALENQKSILEVVIMGYEMWEIWMAIRRFLIGWAVALGILFVASCIRYHAFIAEAFVSHTGVLINGIMPILLILFGIGYALKTVFR